MATGPRPRRKKRSWKFKLLVLVVGLAAIGAVAYFNLKKEKQAEKFATVRVERGNLVDKLAETGSIELVRTVEVKSTVSGEIRELPVQAGDWVEKDQLVAVIEPDPAQSLQLYQKRSAVEQAGINLREQENRFARNQSLFDRQMLAAQEFEEAQTRLVRARTNLRLAELELEILETKANLKHVEDASDLLQLDEVRVLAPISGIAIRRDVEIGEVVASGTSSFSGGTVLFEIGDPSQMIVAADIAEIDIGQLQTGQHVDLVVDAYPDTTYRGEVHWIAPVGQKKPGSTIVTFDVEIDILDREPRLRQGMSCDLDIIFTRRDSTLYLPVEVVLEVFDDEEKDDEEEVKGRRGRFIAYVHKAPPDSVTDAGADSSALAAGDSLAGVSADSATAAATVEPSDAETAAVAGAAGARVPADTLAAASRETSADSLAGAPADMSAADTLAAATADSTSSAEEKEPPKVVLAEFEELELQVGLETTTRIEVLTGLEEGDLVAADPELIRRKQKEEAEKAKKPETEDKGWF